MLAIFVGSLLLAGGVLLADPVAGLDQSPRCLVLGLLHGTVPRAAGDCPFSDTELGLHTLGSAQSNYSWWNRPRSNNLERAATLLDGLVLAPGAELSFNTVIGERSRSRGFKRAKIISPEGYTEGIGGGVCQAASMLHAAALYAGLKVVERHPHRFRVKYVAPGLDATVDFGRKDLRLVNPYPFPVRVGTASNGKGGLYFTITGPYRLQETLYRYRIIESLPSDKVRFLRAHHSDPLEFYGRPSLHIQREFNRLWSFGGRTEHRFIGKDKYEASPWQLRRPDVEPRTLTGLSQPQIQKLLEGTSYRVEDAAFPDVAKEERRWLPPKAPAPAALATFAPLTPKKLPCTDLVACR